MLQKLLLRCSAWLPAIALVSGLAMTSSAVAGIITKWDYTIQSLFTAWAPAVGVTPFNAGDGLDTGLEWGDDPKSSLAIDTNSSGEIETYLGGGAVPIAWAEDGDTITHNNNPITGSSLTSATITSTLTLTPNTPPAGGSPSISPLQINIAFAETPNAPPCASAGSPVPCNDIFVLTGGLLNSSFTFNSGDGVDQQYYVNVFPIAGTQLSLLSAAECSAAGAPNGCIGFSTVEEQSNRVQFGFTISTEKLTVPEPAVLALFGLGLIGMGAMRRQKHAA